MRKKTTRRSKLRALKKESDRAELEMIRRWLALPQEKRTNFLRKRVTYTGSCL